jgi:uncharacterized repeat protein (TIGR01451 family)
MNIFARIIKSLIPSTRPAPAVQATLQLQGHAKAAPSQATAAPQLVLASSMANTPHRRAPHKQALTRTAAALMASLMVSQAVYAACGPLVGVTASRADLTYSGIGVFNNGVATSLKQQIKGVFTPNTYVDGSTVPYLFRLDNASGACTSASACPLSPSGGVNIAHTPGMDPGPKDDVIRPNDYAGYQIGAVISGTTENNVIVTATLDKGVWDQSNILASQCPGGLSFSTPAAWGGGNTTLTCNMGTVTPGTNLINVSAYINGPVADGTPVNVAVTTTSASCTAASSPTPPVAAYQLLASAAKPTLDVVKWADGSGANRTTRLVNGVYVTGVDLKYVMGIRRYVLEGATPVYDRATEPLPLNAAGYVSIGLQDTLDATLAASTAITLQECPPLYTRHNTPAPKRGQTGYGGVADDESVIDAQAVCSLAVGSVVVPGQAVGVQALFKESVIYPVVTARNANVSGDSGPGVPLPAGLLGLQWVKPYVVFVPDSVLPVSGAPKCVNNTLTTTAASINTQMGSTVSVNNNTGNDTICINAQAASASTGLAPFKMIGKEALINAPNYYKSNYYGLSAKQYLLPGSAGNTGATNGSGSLNPGDIFVTAPSYSAHIGEGTVNKFTSITVCDFIDPNRTEVVPLASNPLHAATFGPVGQNAGEAVHTMVMPQAYYDAAIIQYATATVATPVTNCMSPSITWYNNLTSVPGGASAVQKIRVTYPNPIEFTHLITVPIAPINSALDRGFFIRQKIKLGVAPGQIVADDSMTFYSTASATNQFGYSGYSSLLAPNGDTPQTQSVKDTCSTSTGSALQGAACLVVATSTVKIEKTNSITSSQSTGTVSPGQQFSYNLNAELKSVNDGVVDTISLYDILPAGIDYLSAKKIVGGAAILPTSITTLASTSTNTAKNTPYPGPSGVVYQAGTTIIRFDIPNAVSNDGINYGVTLSAKVSTTVANAQTLTNTVYASTPKDASANDPADPTLRSAQTAVVVSATPALRVSKQVDKPVTDATAAAPNDTLTYRVNFMNTNSGALDIPAQARSMDVIDVLPFVGDSASPFLRTPSTAAGLGGRVRLEAAPTMICDAGKTVGACASPAIPAPTCAYYYTADAPASLEQDPDAASNTIAGLPTAKWCPALSGGACPSGFGDATAKPITAVRAVCSSSFVNATVYAMVLPSRLYAHVGGDIYSNAGVVFSPVIGPPSVASAPVTTVIKNGSISGKVFADMNADGIEAASDLPIVGASIQVLSWNGSVCSPFVPAKTAITDAKGEFTVLNLVQGDYCLEQTLPVGYTNGSRKIGTGGGLVAATGAIDRITAIKVGASENAVGYVFGEIPPGELGVTKQLTSSTFVGIGSPAPDNIAYDVSYKLIVKNLSTTLPATAIQLKDCLLGTGCTFGTDASQLSVTAMPTVNAACPATLSSTLSATYNAQAIDSIFTGAGTLSAGGRCEIDFTVRLVFPRASAINLSGYMNQATLLGAFNGASVIDSSNDKTGIPLASADPSSADEKVATQVIFNPPLIGVVKSVGVPVQTAPAIFDIPYTIRVENLSGVALPKVQITEDLNAAFKTLSAPGVNPIISFTVAPYLGSGSLSTLTINPGFNGTTITDLLIENSSSIAISGARYIAFTVSVNYGTPANVPTTTRNNSVTAKAKDAAGTLIASDASTDITSRPTSIATKTDVPSVTPVTLPVMKVQSAKRVKTGPTQIGASTYRVEYEVLVRNTGTVAATNVQITDDLAAVFATPAGTTYAISTPPSCSAGITCVGAGAYTGNGTGIKLLSGTDTLPTGVSDYAVSFTVDITTPGGTTAYTYNNQATVTAKNAGGTLLYTDLSDNGINPLLTTDLPTPVVLQPAKIGIAKKVQSITQVVGATDTFDVVYRVTVGNYGPAASNIQVIDDLAASYPSPAQIISVTPPVNAPATCPAPFTCMDAVVNAGATKFDGQTNKVLAVTAGMPTGVPTPVTYTMDFTVRVKVVLGSTYNNTAKVQQCLIAQTNATNNCGTVLATDNSQDGLDPDVTTGGLVANNGDKDPSNNNVPTPAVFNAPVLTLTKALDMNPLVVGTVAKYTLNISNATGTAASTTPVVVSDCLPTAFNAVVAADITGASGFACSLAASVPASCPAGTTQAVVCSTSTAIAAGAASTKVVDIAVTPKVAAIGTTPSNEGIINSGDPACPAGGSAAPVAWSASFPARCHAVVATSPVIGTPTLNLTKAAAPTSFPKGGAGNYTITVTNAGTAATTGTTMTVVDTLSPGVTVNAGGAGAVALLATSSTGWTCNSAIVSAGVQKITCTSSNIIPSTGANTNTIAFVANVSASATDANNTATVTGGGDSTCPPAPGVPLAHCTGSVAVSVTAPALQTGKSAGKTGGSTSSFVVGTNAATGQYYEITIKNTGSAATYAVVNVQDALPLGITHAFAGASPFTPGGADGANYRCTVTAGPPQTVDCASVTAPTAYSIAATVTSTIRIPVDVASTAVGNTGGNNTAHAYGGGDPICTAANSAGAACAASLTLPVYAPGLSITKSPSVSPLVYNAAGQFYSVTVSNSGGAPSVGTITVSDTLPTGLTANFTGASPYTPAGANGANWSCTVAAPVVTCTSSTVIAAVSGTSVFQIPVNVGAVAVPSVTNPVRLYGGGDTVCTGVASAGATCTNSVTTPVVAPGLKVTKTATPTVFVVGAPNQTYDIKVDNTGGVPTVGSITVTDTLPPGVSPSLVGSPFTPTGTNGANWSCTVGAASLITCTSAAPALVATTGTSSFSILVTVGSTAGTLGNANNTAHVFGGGDPTCTTATSTATNCLSTTNVPVLTPAVGLAKRVVSVAQVPAAVPAQFDVMYSMVVESTGTASLPNVQVSDDLAATYGNAANVISVTALGATYSTGVGTTNSGTECAVNSAGATAFNGTTRINLLSGSATLEPSERCTIVFTVRVQPNSAASTCTPAVNATYCNTANAASYPVAPAAVGGTGTGTALATDISDSGSNPTGTNAGQPGDTGAANDPTPVLLNTAKLSVVKSASPSPFVVGQSAVYNVTVSNAATGAPTVAPMSISDQMPLGIVLNNGAAGVVSVANTSWTCSVDALGGAVTRQTLTCNTVAAYVLAAGANSILTIPVFVLPAALGASGATNTANLVGGGDPTCTVATPCPGTTPVTPVVTGSADVSIIKQAPVSVAPNGVFSYSIKVRNEGPSAVTNVTVQDVLPANFTNAAFASPACVASGGGVCPVAPTLALLNAGTLTVPALPAGGQIVLTITGKAPGNGVVQNTATVTIPATAAVGDSDPSNNTSTVKTTVNIPLSTNADLKITKVGPSIASASGAVSYTIVVSNSGPGAADGAMVKDTPTGVAIGSVVCAAASAGASCPAVLSAAQLTGSGLTIPALPMGGTVTLTVAGVAPASGTFTNTATVTPPVGVTDPVLTDNTSTTSGTVGVITGTADVFVIKSAPAVVNPGEAMLYEIVVGNNGPDAANGSTLKDALPAGFTPTAAPTCVAAGATVSAVCPVGLTVTDLTNGVVIPALPAGGRITVTVIGTAPASGTLVNTATVTTPATVLDPVLGNNVSEVMTQVPVLTTDLAIQKNGPVQTTAGSVVTYTLTASNNGPNAANNTVVTDVVPSPLTGVTVSCTAPHGGAVCPTSAGLVIMGNTVKATIPTFPSGGALTLTVTGAVPAGAVTGSSFTNIATITPPAGVVDPIASNNTSNPVVTTISQPSNLVDLSITKLGTTVVNASDALTYTLTVVNAGPGVANGATVTDTLPAGLSNVVVSCGNATAGAVCGTFTATNAAVNGALTIFPAGASATITITATAPAAVGSIVNTATIAAPTGVTDTNATNNTSSATTTINAAGTSTTSADLAVVKTGTTAVAPKGAVTYSIVVTNNGPDAANGTLVDDAIPSVLTAVSASCFAEYGAVCGATTVAVGNLFNNTIPTLPSGGRVTYTITATAPASGSFSNTVKVSPPVGVSDPNVTNNIGGPVITALLQNLTVVKTIGQPVLLPGTQRTYDLPYTVKVSNVNLVAPLINTQVFDDVQAGLPAGLTASDMSISNAPILGTGCTVAGLTALNTGFNGMTAGNTKLLSGSQAMAPASSCEIKFTVRVKMDNATSKLVNNTATATTSALPIATVAAADASASYAAPIRLVDPQGVVYDDVLRTPIPGATVTLTRDASCSVNMATQWTTGLAGGFSSSSATSVSTITGADGRYQFLLIPPAADCNYTITITPPAGYYSSTLITANPALTTPTFASGIAYNVPTAAQGGLGVITPFGAPGQPGVTPAPSTSTVFHWTFNAFGANSTDVFNNNLPLSSPKAGSLTIQKSSSKSIAEVGDTVVYTLKVSNRNPSALNNVLIKDILPAGFTMVSGTLFGATLESGSTASNLTFKIATIPAKGSVDVTYRVLLGVGSMEGTGTNSAYAQTSGVACYTNTLIALNTGSVLCSNIAKATVKVTAGVFTPQACVIGKVFADCNKNGIQDNEEIGIPGVKLYMLDGTSIITDVEGKYSICDLKPQTGVLAVDRSTMPRGSLFGTTSNRNALDGSSLFIDLKKGELHRADFSEASCSNGVLEQIKSRRAQGEVRAAETEKSRAAAQPALNYQAKPVLGTNADPIQTTDGANQPAINVRQNNRQ